MSPEEKSRFDRLSQDDQLKLKSVMQMIQKEKNSKKNMKEDLDSFSYIDGLLNQNLVKKFVDTFEAIYADITEQGDFERNDVAQVLASYMIDRGSKWRAMNEDDRRTSQTGKGQLYVQDAVQKEIKFHLDAYDKGIIDVDDLIHAIEDIIFGHVVAPGQRSEASGEIGVDQQGDTTRDINVTDDTSMYDPLKEDLKDLAKKSGIKLSDLLDKINTQRSIEKDQIEKDAFKQSALAEEYVDFQLDPYDDREAIERQISDLIRAKSWADDSTVREFLDTHWDDILNMSSDDEILDEYNEFLSVNYEGSSDMRENKNTDEVLASYMKEKKNTPEKEVDEGVEFFKKIGGITPLTGIGNGGLM